MSSFKIFTTKTTPTPDSPIPAPDDIVSGDHFIIKQGTAEKTAEVTSSSPPLTRVEAALVALRSWFKQLTLEDTVPADTPPAGTAPKTLHQLPLSDVIDEPANKDDNILNNDHFTIGR